MPKAPTPVAKLKVTGTVGLTVTVDSSESTVSSGTISRRRYDWGDGLHNDQAPPVASHTYKTAGTYDIKLTVWGSLGGSSSVKVRVGMPAPPVPIPVPPDPPIPVPPDPIPPIPIPPDPTPPTPTPAGVLQPSDFTYLGSVGVPNQNEGGTNFGYSNGAITGRVVNGEIHLFIAQSPDGVGGGTDSVAEVRYAGVGNRMTLVANWGDVTKGKRVTGHNNYKPIRGLLWDPVTSQLFWAYGDHYNAGSPDWDPSIGASTLSGSDNSGVTAYGPWRLGPTVSQKTRGYLYPLPASMQAALGGKRIASGAPPTSGNATSPFGAFATAWAPIPNATPADTTGNAHVSIPCTDLIYTDINNPQARPGDTDICNWLHYGETDSQGNQPQANPVQNGSGCTPNGELCGVTISAGPITFNSLDQLTAAAWIEGPTKQGVIYIGQLCRTIPGHTYAGNGRNHVWYGPTQGPGLHLCPHGQNGYVYGQSTGEGTTTMLSSLYIYDPADLLAVANGTKTAASVRPVTDGYDMSQIPNSGSPFPQVANGPYKYGGCWFEPGSKLLFVSETSVEPWAVPIVHVFTVNC